MNLMKDFWMNIRNEIIPGFSMPNSNNNLFF